MTSRITLAVYGDLDLNLLDGSAVWLTSLVQVLARHPETDVHVFLKAPETRDLLTSELRELPGITLVPPEVNQRDRRLSPRAALDRIQAYDPTQFYDAIILRGFDLCTDAASRHSFRGRLWCYLTDIPQSRDKLSDDILSRLKQICNSSSALLCQTEDFRAHIEGLVPESRGKCYLLPPMIPPDKASSDKHSPREPKPRIGYAGKFAPLWATREMIRCFTRLQSERPDAELHVYGDKIHDPADDPRFKDEIRKSLEDTKGVYWHGAVSRERLAADLRELDVAWSWRLPELDYTLELSTKVLEYGAAGLPVILNRNDMNVQLLGESYPLFAATEDELHVLLATLADDPELLKEASRTVRAVSADFTFDAVYQSFARPLLQKLTQVRQAGTRNLPRVLIAGHDLRFAKGIIQELSLMGYEIIEDQWDGHNVHREAQSRRLLDQTDVIWCEWCLGSAVWYSQNKRASQRLIVRFHAQELRTDYPRQLNVPAVDHIVFVSEHIRRQAKEKFKWDFRNYSVIGKSIDALQLDRVKLRGAQYNLGLLGMCPRVKRMDRCLDVLESLRAVDRRYNLFIKGKLPVDYEWLWARNDERTYYQSVFDRLARSPALRNAVVFDDYGNDVPAWFRKVGWIVSSSESESFHLAVAEGAASGALPIVFPWNGASQVYPERWVVDDAQNAVSRVLDMADHREKDNHQRQCKSYALEYFAQEPVAKQFAAVLDPDE